MGFLDKFKMAPSEEAVVVESDAENKAIHKLKEAGVELNEENITKVKNDILRDDALVEDQEREESGFSPEKWKELEKAKNEVVSILNSNNVYPEYNSNSKAKKILEKYPELMTIPRFADEVFDAGVGQIARSVEYQDAETYTWNFISNFNIPAEKIYANDEIRKKLISTIERYAKAGARDNADRHWPRAHIRLLYSCGFSDDVIKKIIKEKIEEAGYNTDYYALKYFDDGVKWMRETWGYEEDTKKEIKKDSGNLEDNEFGIDTGLEKEKSVDLGIKLDQEKFPEEYEFMQKVEDLLQKNDVVFLRALPGFAASSLFMHNADTSIISLDAILGEELWDDIFEEIEPEKVLFVDEGNLMYMDDDEAIKSTQFLKDVIVNNSAKTIIHVRPNQSGSLAIKKLSEALGKNYEGKIAEIDLPFMKNDAKVFFKEQYGNHNIPEKYLDFLIDEVLKYAVNYREANSGLSHIVVVQLSKIDFEKNEEEIRNNIVKFVEKWKNGYGAEFHINIFLDHIQNDPLCYDKIREVGEVGGEKEYDIDELSEEEKAILEKYGPKGFYVFDIDEIEEGKLKVKLRRQRLYEIVKERDSGKHWQKR